MFRLQNFLQNSSFIALIWFYKFYITDPPDILIFLWYDNNIPDCIVRITNIIQEVCDLDKMVFYKNWIIIAIIMQVPVEGQLNFKNFIIMDAHILSLACVTNRKKFT